MDSDESGGLSLSEYLIRDYGMQLAAVAAGREDAYEAALRVAFAFWGRNGDGTISRAEHRHSLSTDFRWADTDNDALLTMAEFTGGFSVMVVLWAAINPAPAE